MESISDKAAENTKCDLKGEWGSEINNTSEGKFALEPAGGGLLSGNFEGQPILVGKCHGPASSGGKERITLLREDGNNLYLYTGIITVESVEPPVIKARGRRRIIGKPTDVRDVSADTEQLFDEEWVGTRPPT